MTTLNYQKFTDTHFLKTIKPKRLRRFLQPFGSYLATRGLDLKSTGQLTDEQFDLLASIVKSPDGNAPAEMLDALHVVNGVSNRIGVDLLFDQIFGLPAKFADEDDPFAGDVAIEAFLLDKHTVQWMLSHRSNVQRRSFTAFQAASLELPKLPADMTHATRCLERCIDDWYDSRCCGRGSTVLSHQDDAAAYFTISHGSTMHRQRILADGRHDHLVFRPLLDDIAIFDKLIGELRINAETQSQHELYRRMIGLHIFGDEALFPKGDLYTLAPLLEFREEPLSVASIDELTAAECHAVKILLPGHKSEELTARRQDVLEVLKDRIDMLRRVGFAELRLTEAKFGLTFRESRRSRMVTIKPPNVAIYSRDGDGEVIERFLRFHGFINDREWQSYAIAGNALASG